MSIEKSTWKNDLRYGDEILYKEKKEREREKICLWRNEDLYETRASSN